MSEESLIREVEEEVRKEQLKRLWERFGAYIIAVCFAVILIVGGYKLWQYYEQQRALSAGQQYVEAMQLASEGKTAEAQAAFAELAETSGEGPRTLATLQEAALRVSQDDVTGAVSAYDTIAADTNASPVLRDLARIRAGFLLVDTASVAELEERVGSLNEAGNPWRNGAREIIALAAYRTGDLEKANELLSEIMGDPRASMGSRQRAQILSSIVTVALGAKPVEAGPAETTPAETPPAAANDAQQAPSTEMASPDRPVADAPTAPSNGIAAPSPRSGEGTAGADGLEAPATNQPAETPAQTESSSQ